MTFAYSDLTPKELEAFGYARVRDVAFNAIRVLWHRRRGHGMTQNDLAAKIGRDPAWVSRKLQGPGNWTLRTIGAFVAALDGEIEIKVHAVEDPPDALSNHPGAYEGHGNGTQAARQGGSDGSQIVGERPRRLGIASPSPARQQPTSSP